MADTIAVPGMGPVKKKWAVIGVGITAVIITVAYVRHRGSLSAAPAATDPNAVDPSAIDPATGIPYAEEAAGIAAGNLSGYGTGLGDTSGIIGYDAQGQPIYTDQVGYGPTPSFVNNAAWAQAVQQYMVSSTGADAGVIAAALGAYLNGQPLSEAQASVVHQATGFFGPPPQQGSNGFPPGLKMAAPQTGGTGGGTGGGTSALAAPTGLSVTPHAGFADFGWGKVPGAGAYEIRVVGPTPYDHVAPGNHAEKVPLKNGSYSFTVRAGASASDVHGHWSAIKRFTVGAKAPAGAGGGSSPTGEPED
jgi:hypothetical protein